MNKFVPPMQKAFITSKQKIFVTPECFNRGSIKINDLKVRTLIGAYSWEKVNRQELIINISIEYDASRACVSDKLKDALNYDALAARVIKTVERSRYTLIEKLTAKILAGIMADKRVQKATVRVDKPQAIPQAKSVSFELSAIFAKRST